MSMSDELERLQRLHASGTLTDEEFAQAKAKLLDGPSFASSSGSSAETARLWRIGLHLSQLAGYVAPFAGFVLPIVLWQVMKTDYPELDVHGRRITNWIISHLIYVAISVGLVFFGIGIPLLAILAVLGIVFPIIGAVRASEGQCWDYPLSITFFPADLTEGD